MLNVCYTVHTYCSDIMMMLDDVVSSVRNDAERFEEATHRTIRWLDRCIAAHKRPADQNLFAIVQGGLNPVLRNYCVDEFLKRDADLPGYAIGGLAGGEDKSQFWRVVFHSAWRLPRAKPKYLMGVGYPLDLVVCVCLGVDMFDCVWPSRSARFGIALVPEGTINVKKAVYRTDDAPLDAKCTCLACTQYSRAYLHAMAGKEPASCHLLTLHNLTYMMRLMGEIRTAILQDELPQFVKGFLVEFFPTQQWPRWVEEALVASGMFQATGLPRKYPDYDYEQDDYFIQAEMTSGKQFDIHAADHTQ
jgi:tRNA-guanine transglycosylase